MLFVICFRYLTCFTAAFDRHIFILVPNRLECPRRKMAFSFTSCMCLHMYNGLQSGHISKTYKCNCETLTFTFVCHVSVCKCLCVCLLYGRLSIYDSENLSLKTDPNTCTTHPKGFDKCQVITKWINCKLLPSHYCISLLGRVHWQHN